MPIVFRVVSDEDYKQWLVDAKKKFAAARKPDLGSPTRSGDSLALTKTQTA